VRGLLKLPPNRRCVNCDGLVRALFFPALFHPCGPRRAASSPLLVCRRAQCLLTSRPLCLCVCDSDPGAAVRVHQLLDLRLRLLQRHPVSAALPFPAPTTGFRTPVLLSAFSVVILSRLLGWECDLQCAFIQTALLVSVQCQSLWRLHSFATLMRIDVAVCQNFRIRVVLISSSTIILTHTDLCTCSREFTHRVKSVSMSTFSTQEVEALQKGGNQVKTCIH
jgi:hypothetical protein